MKEFFKVITDSYLIIGSIFFIWYVLTNTNGFLSDKKIDYRDGTQQTTSEQAPSQEDKSIFEEIDKTLAALPKAWMAFNTPPPLEVDGPMKEIELRIDPHQSATEIEKSLSVPGKVESHLIQISNLMKASLSSDTKGLEINPITPVEQPVSMKTPTQWRWSVKPLKAGEYPVFVDLDARINIDGADTYRSVNVFRGSITVTITNYARVEHFLKENWQWLCTALLIPLGGWWWKKRKDKSAFNVS